MFCCDSLLLLFGMSDVAVVCEFGFSSVDTACTAE